MERLEVRLGMSDRVMYEDRRLHEYLGALEHKHGSVTRKDKSKLASAKSVTNINTASWRNIPVPLADAMQTMRGAVLEMATQVQECHTDI